MTKPKVTIIKPLEALTLGDLDIAENHSEGAHHGCNHTVAASSLKLAEASCHDFKQLDAWCETPNMAASEPGKSATPKQAGAPCG